MILGLPPYIWPSNQTEARKPALRACACTCNAFEFLLLRDNKFFSANDCYGDYGDDAATGKEPRGYDALTTLLVRMVER